TVHRVLSEGGFASVVEATDDFTQRRVAIKLIKSKHEGNEHVARRARGEAVTLSNIRHPNLPMVYRGGVLPGGIVWMSMELLVGQTLDVYAKNRGGRLLVHEAFAIGIAVADACAALHEVNVIHRDLKPSNVHLSRQGEVKLFDLNSSRFLAMGFKSTIPG